MAIRWIQFVVLEFKSTEAIFLFQMNEYGVLNLHAGPVFLIASQTQTLTALVSLLLLQC